MTSQTSKRAAVDPVPGPAVPPSPAPPVAGEGTLDGAAGDTTHPTVRRAPSSQSLPGPRRAAAGIPSPDTGAVRLDRVTAPARGRSRAPAGGAPASRERASAATSVPPAGSSPFTGPAARRAAAADSNAAAGSTAMAVMAAAMSEDDLLISITCGTRKKPGLCKLYGLLYYHTHNSKFSPSGFPDLVIVGRGVMYRELKRQKEDPTSKQEEWITALKAAGEDADVWRPADWLSGRVERELAALAGRRTGAA